MTGHEKRTATKKRRIQQSASELFEKYSFEKVTLEEIAANAKVSRVTIYKYFQNKENLRLVILSELISHTVDEIEDIMKADLPFPEKTKRIVLLKKGMAVLTDNQFIASTISQDGELGGVMTPELLQRVGTIMQEFVAQGRREGFIHRNLTDKMVNAYFKLMRAGIKQLQDKGDPLLNDLEQLGELISISMNGLRYGID